jgi:hypothetical protein
MIQIWLVIGLLLGLAAGSQAAWAQAPTFDSNQFTKPDVVNTDWANYQDIPDNFALVAENDKLQLYADKVTLAFKVLDKRSGYVWHSNLDVVEKDDRLNKTWTAFAQSGLSIDYLDAKGINKRLSVTNAEHTLSEVPTTDGFDLRVTFTDVEITLGVAVHLEPDGVRVDVPFDSIVEANPDYKLGLVYLYPFFGATKQDSVPGYMFIPDGAGSLIRFGAATKAKNMYYGRYYGDDLGMLSTLPFDPSINRAFRLTVPVFGMVHGYKQNAFISIVEQGAAYGEIQAHPAGIITDFNFIYSAFVYNESYFQATNRSGAGVTTLQKATNAFDIKVHYRFLTQAAGDYVGMARSYQQYLVDQGVLKRIADAGSDIGLRLEFLGGDKEPVLLWHRMIAMTTAAQMRDILNDLALKNTDVVYYGWQPLGAASMPPKTLRVDGHLATVDELRTLAADLVAGGGDFYLYLDPQAALRGEGGYSPRNDLAMSITSANLLGYNRFKVNYYLNLDALRRHYAPLSADVFTQLGAGLALDGLGSSLYSDFKDRHFLNREQAIASYQALVSETDGRTAFYAPNDYMFGATEAYYDMPVTNSGYLYTTDVVPFLPIVFAGYVPYYGPALNFSSNMQDDLLRHADFGAYPAYFLTAEVTAKILTTSSNWIYTSSYGQWAPAIKEAYQWLNSRLGPVKGQPVVARDVLATGVVAVTYGNGQQIVVNYTEQPYSAGGVVVPAKDAVLREVTP